MEWRASPALAAEAVATTARSFQLVLVTTDGGGGGGAPPAPHTRVGRVGTRVGAAPQVPVYCLRHATLWPLVFQAHVHGRDEVQRSAHGLRLAIKVHSSSAPESPQMRPV